ncbi:hypothetical protein [Candidatus Entotheonella palauensis]|uniref:Uncharacterized protein n=1 Tax=Candidatus Entotheonella gemina TaxID=1429439 RepID=W4LI03_9BACT|nr:hypothetical protein [Candidatus Entotheonella palauensis]ETW97612.1 MAG: hypothetical protein ETSY2_44325 [Candidatus Entotheonella gemina]
MQWKGIVQGNVVVLDEGAHLPEGSRVTIAIEQANRALSEPTSPDDVEQRQAWMTQVNAFGDRIKDRQIHFGNLVLESREELEERA